MHIIDRRLNPRGKSLENRQRFLRRAKDAVQQAVRRSLQNRNIRDVLDGGEVTLPIDGMAEPSFHRGEGGLHDQVLPGNRAFVEGDIIPRPPGRGGGRPKEAGEGDGEDGFRFVLTREEFLAVFLDDLELPDFAKRRLSETEEMNPIRAGFSVSGSPSNIAIARTTRLAMMRRIAFAAPKPAEIEALQREIEECDSEEKRLLLEAELKSLTDKMRRIPYVDPVDVRYRRFENEPKPVVKAVMFCLMDVSGSMSEHMKDLAKRFYLLLYLFLSQRYEKVEIVFIRHTEKAEEVDEETFFYGQTTVATLVSSALAAMRGIIAERFDPTEWNIYAAQASDGDNSYRDESATGHLLQHEILPLCQYFAYIEVGEEESDSSMSSSPLWSLYESIRSELLPLAMRKVCRKNEIFPVFHELFPEAAGEGDTMTKVARQKERLLFDGADWDFATLQRIHDACEEIALGELGLDVYPNQIEVITAEQMLDAYSSTGMPLFYRHWSFGKHFAHHEAFYRRGMRDLAYEIVINSSPCISYLMEENTATMQTLVIAHAAFGHNHFFKNNYLFKLWTDAEGILDYLDFAKGYITRCEERYGEVAVERTLDAAHALMSHGVHRYAGKTKVDLRQEEKRQQERRVHEEQVFNDLWRTVPTGPKRNATDIDIEKRRAALGLPQDNILYFLEKSAPRLRPWQREILRIVRHVAQYFHPQRQTKVMNEGTATYVHYKIMERLHERGQLSDGHYFEFLKSHTNVVFQPAYDDRRFSGFNPYALGFAMMRDIERIVTNPTNEDRDWFPDIAGKGDAMEVLRGIWADYRDESFISQFLSPRLIRQWRLFQLHDDPEIDEGILVSAIHDERGYKYVRRQLAREYDIGWTDPGIDIVDVDLAGDRRLLLQHRAPNDWFLEEHEAKLVLQHLADLWGYDVLLQEVDDAGGVVKEHVAHPRHALYSDRSVA